MIYNDRKLDSIIQDKSHIIIELKEKVKTLEKGKIGNSSVTAPGINKVDKNNSKPLCKTSNLNASTSSGLVATPSASRSRRPRLTMNRIWKRKDGKLEPSQVEDQSRKKNKNHVSTALGSSFSKNNSNVSVTNDEPMCAFKLNASCVFCHKNILSGDHAKCVLNLRLNQRKKRTSGVPTRPKIPSRSNLVKMPPVVSSNAVVAPVAAKTKSTKTVVVTEFIKRKASTTSNWQRWLEKTHHFNWIPKATNVHVSNPLEPTTSSGSTLTVVPSLSLLCDAGGTSSSLDC